MDRCILFALTLAIASGCSAPERITTYSDEGTLHPVCGFQNPEDLALLNDGRTLLVSQMGGMMEDRSGSLALFDLGG